VTEIQYNTLFYKNLFIDFQIFIAFEDASLRLGIDPGLFCSQAIFLTRLKIIQIEDVFKEPL